MIRPERIAHVVIRVRDLQRSRTFYTEVLGMDVMMEAPALRGVFLANNGSPIGMEQFWSLRNGATGVS
jgi:catechol 2,3-dioxygenase-like lactoylglutathione lyase family enzyme